MLSIQTNHSIKWQNFDRNHTKVVHNKSIIYHISSKNLGNSPDKSTLLNDLNSLANSLSFCLVSLSILKLLPEGKLVPGANDHFIPGKEDPVSVEAGYFGFGASTLSTTFHKTVSWISKSVACPNYYRNIRWLIFKQYDRCLCMHTYLHGSAWA